MLIEFRISAIADAQTVPRVLEHFALRGLVPSSLTAKLDGDELHMVIEHPGLDAHLADLIAEKVRAGVLIRSVQLNSIDRQGA